MIHFLQVEELASEGTLESGGKATRRRSGIPAGNAGEYFVMGELLRRGFDAQLADRNTKDYDVLLGQAEESALHKVQVKTVRAAPWYVKVSDFNGSMLDRITIYVLLGNEKAPKEVRFFITVNRDLAAHLHQPPGWPATGFISLKAVNPYEGSWLILKKLWLPPAVS